MIIQQKKNKIFKKIFGEKIKFIPPTLKESVLGMEGRYKERVKPHLNSESWFKAYIEMLDIATYLELHAREICSEFHSGLGYIAAARLLREDLKNATKKPEYTIKWFEAMQAQIKLPLK